MANQNWPFGAMPVRGPFDSAPETVRYPLRQAVQSTKQTTAIFKGQIVLRAATGWAKANDATTSTNAILGVAAEYYKGSASTKTDIAVYTRNNVFKILLDNTTATNLFQYLHKIGPVVNPASGSTVTGQSSMKLDFSALELATVGGPFQIVDVKYQPGGGVAQANPTVHVRFAPGVGLGDDAGF